jgi:hypothetical protein
MYVGYRAHPDIYQNMLFEETPEWRLHLVFGGARDKPHVGCMITESTVPENGSVLRSELLT